MPLWFASRGSSTEPRVPCQLPRSAPLRAVGRSPLSGRRARRRSMLARRALGHARSATFGRTAHPPIARAGALPAPLRIRSAALPARALRWASRACPARAWPRALHARAAPEAPSARPCHTIKIFAVLRTGVAAPPAAKAGRKHPIAPRKATQGVTALPAQSLRKQPSLSLQSTEDPQSSRKRPKRIAWLLPEGGEKTSVLWRRSSGGEAAEAHSRKDS